MCKFFLHGGCSRGSSCTYLHELPKDANLTKDSDGSTNVKGMVFNLNAKNTFTALNKQSSVDVLVSSESGAAHSAHDAANSKHSTSMHTRMMSDTSGAMVGNYGNVDVYNAQFAHSNSAMWDTFAAVSQAGHDDHSGYLQSQEYPENVYASFGESEGAYYGSEHDPYSFQAEPHNTNVGNAVLPSEGTHFYDFESGPSFSRPSQPSSQESINDKMVTDYVPVRQTRQTTRSSSFRGSSTTYNSTTSTLQASLSSFAAGTSSGLVSGSSLNVHAAPHEPSRGKSSSDLHFSKVSSERQVSAGGQETSNDSTTLLRNLSNMPSSSGPLGTSSKSLAGPRSYAAAAQKGFNSIPILEKSARPEVYENDLSISETPLPVNQRTEKNSPSVKPASIVQSGCGVNYARITSGSFRADSGKGLRVSELIDLNSEINSEQEGAATASEGIPFSRQVLSRNKRQGLGSSNSGIESLPSKEWLQRDFSAARDSKAHVPHPTKVLPLPPPVFWAARTPSNEVRKLLEAILPEIIVPSPHRATERNGNKSRTSLYSNSEAGNTELGSVKGYNRQILHSGQKHSNKYVNESGKAKSYLMRSRDGEGSGIYGHSSTDEIVHNRASRGRANISSGMGDANSRRSAQFSIYSRTRENLT